MTPDCTTRRPVDGNHPDGSHLHTALALAAAGVPVLPLRRGKVPFGNCPSCKDGACGGRPNMKAPGPCRCPAPCHAWAAATTDPHVLTSPAWAPVWGEAVALAYHPGGAGLTVVDLDNAAAVDWARATLPETRTVPTTRGEHWLYLGAMPSANAVRPGVDIKSLTQYARWLGPGTGRMASLPSAVRALVVKEETTPARRGVASSSRPRHVVATGGHRVPPHRALRPHRPGTRPRPREGPHRIRRRITGIRCRPVPRRPTHRLPGTVRPRSDRRGDRDGRRLRRRPGGLRAPRGRQRP